MTGELDEVQVSLRLPRFLMDAIDVMAKMESRNRSLQIRHQLIQSTIDSHPELLPKQFTDPQEFVRDELAKLKKVQPRNDS